MDYCVLNKTDLAAFITGLTARKKVMGPVKKDAGNYAFAEIKEAGDMSLLYIPTILPPKKYFMPQKEILLSWDSGKNPGGKAVLEYEKIVLFGVHTCDLAGIQCLDLVFSEKPQDINYLKRKAAITVIGLECNTYCDEYASCATVNNHLPAGGYDLFFTDLGDCFIAHIKTAAGQEIADKAKLFKPAEESHLKRLESLREEKKRIFKLEMGAGLEAIHAAFDTARNSPVWEDVGNRCIACTNCTNVCPTCYCFDVWDETDLNLKTGRRVRRWDSCQAGPFAEVTGGENFRKERSQKQRHRYYRKFSFAVDKWFRSFCTGCGRCTRTCMARISLKETVSSILKEKAS